jgi:charged multivesicular body protein 2A
MIPWLFNWGSKKKTAEEHLRDCQITIAMGKREIERTIEDLKYDIDGLMEKARETAEAGKRQEVVQIAKQIVKKRRITDKMQNIIWKLDDAATTIAIVKSTETMQRTMVDITRVMQRMTRGINVRGMDKILNEFEKQLTIMDAKQESIDKTLDDSMSAFSDEPEEKELLQQIFDEIGISVDLPETKSTLNNNNSLDEDLQERLRKLRNE